MALIRRFCLADHVSANFSMTTLVRRIVILPIFAIIAGCAGANIQSSKDGGYVEIPNPAYTMSPNSPEKIWVPQQYVESGVARGNELLKRSYDTVKGGVPTFTSQAVFTKQAERLANLIPHFGVVVKVDGEKVYFNLGKDAGIVLGQKLKVYRGGTVIEGLGLAPGESVGMIEVLGFVGTAGGYGLLKQGGPARNNDLIGAE